MADPVRTKGRARLVQAYLPYAALAANVYFLFVQTPDDAFITYRYAANLISGNGPVFNHADPVEGCSSPLHMLLSAAVMLATRSEDVLFAMKLAGLVFGALTIAIMAPLGRRLGLSPAAILVAQLLAALNPNFAASTVNGLETSLYMFVVAATVHQFVVEANRGSGWLSGILAFLALFTRPDGLIVFGALALLRAIYARQRQLSIRQFILPWVTAFVLPAAALVNARLIYYGYPFPNTYYAKDVSIPFGIQNGVRYLTKALAVRTNHVFDGEPLWFKVVISVSGVVFWALLLVGGWQARRRSALLACVAVAAADVTFVLKSGGDWMEGWRFCVPALPFMALLQSEALRTLAARVTTWGRSSFQRARVLSGAAVAFFALMSVGGPHRAWHDAQFSTSGRGLLAATLDVGVSGLNQVTVGDWIAKNLPTNTSVAYSEMGYAGMVNRDKTFIDFFGLITKEIAHGAPKSMKQQLGVLDRQWFNLDSPVGKAFLLHRPRYILANCANRKTALDDYVLTKTLPASVTNGPPLCVYQPARDANLEPGAASDRVSN